MQTKIVRLIPFAVLALWAVSTWLPNSQAQKSGAPFSPNIPKVWDEAALAEWETPVAGLNQRPQHISEKEYYALTVENLRTYPVYLPGREPEGYWEKLQKVGPTPLIKPEKLKTESAWIEAGRMVFEEADHLHLRTLDPKFVAAARNRETFDKARMQALPDGTVFGMRWVPTKQGVALSFNNCSNCHVSYRANGMRIDGAPASAEASRARDFIYRTPLIGAVQLEGHIVTGATPFRMGAEPLGMWLYRAYGVPWLKDDPNERMKTLTQTEYIPWISAFAYGGAVPRWNGSLYYPAKMPDLIGVKNRKYFDHTGTHLHRGIGDLMRYAAQVSYAETAEFGPHRVLAPDTKRVQARLPDEALYALALYIYSLKPPPNPNLFDDKAQVGEKLLAHV